MGGPGRTGLSGSVPPGHLVLVGLMRTGKSTVGALLAARLGRALIDNDVELVRRYGSDAATMAARRGLDSLHAAEAGVLAEALAHPVPAVITAAAGVVEDERSRELLAGATVVWLRAVPVTLAGRERADDHRPDPVSSGVGTPEEQARRRASLYRRVADVVVDVDELTPEAVADRVLAALRPAP